MSAEWAQAYRNADRELIDHMRAVGFMYPRREFLCWVERDDKGASFILGEWIGGEGRPIETFKRLIYADYGVVL